MQIKEKKLNAGFSLIELLVVVAIMGVLLSGAVMSWYTINSNNVEKSGEFIDNALAECKGYAKTMAADSWTVELTNDTVQVYKYVSDSSGVVSDELILSENLPGNVDISVKMNTGEQVDLTSNADKVIIEYKILTGEIKNIYAEKDGTSWPVYINGTVYASYKYCDIISKHNKRENTIRLYFTTGKHIMK